MKLLEKRNLKRTGYGRSVYKVTIIDLTQSGIISLSGNPPPAEHFVYLMSNYRK